MLTSQSTGSMHHTHGWVVQGQSYRECVLVGLICIYRFAVIRVRLVVMPITALCVSVVTDDVKQDTASFAIGCVMELITTHCKFYLYIYLFIYLFIYNISLERK